jgi:hypothetical protein
MSIPLIDLSNPDIAQLAEQVKDACSVHIVDMAQLANFD